MAARVSTCSRPPGAWRSCAEWPAHRQPAVVQLACVWSAQLGRRTGGQGKHADGHDDHEPGDVGDRLAPAQRRPSWSATRTDPVRGPAGPFRPQHSKGAGRSSGPACLASDHCSPGRASVQAALPVQARAGRAVQEGRRTSSTAGTPMIRPPMTPTRPARGMEAAPWPVLEPVMKTAVSRPSRRVVVKASRKMPVLPALLLTCAVQEGPASARQYAASRGAQQKLQVGHGSL